MDAPFKIIFMDCNMPQMDGFETTTKILELCQKYNTEKPYIVALTAHSLENK
jgi:CheY-like chemotaxis protein